MGSAEFFPEIILGAYMNAATKGVLQVKRPGDTLFDEMKHWINPEACTQADLAVLQ